MLIRQEFAFVSSVFQIICLFFQIITSENIFGLFNFAFMFLTLGFLHLVEEKKK